MVCAAALLGGVAVALAQPATEPPQQAQEQPAEELSPEDQARRAKVVAKVGEVEITIGDVEDQIGQQSPFLRARYREPEKLRELVQNMVRFELLAREAQKQGYGTNESVVRSVKQNSVQTLIRREFDERITPESIPDAEVREYYESHQAEFHRDEMVRASHILVADRAAADRLLSELAEADARAFRQAAREHSVDTETKLRGGDLRYFTRQGQGPNARDAAVDSAIVEAAFGLREVGDTVAEPVRVGERWSIVKLTGRRPAEHRTIEEADQGIRLRLWRQRRQDGIERFVTELRERYRPEIHEDRMRPIRLDPAPEQARAGGDPHGEPETDEPAE